MKTKIHMELGFPVTLLCAGMGCASAAEGITYYYICPQGSILATADATRQIISSADYRPYGSQALGMPEQGPGYAGHVNDADTGLVYVQQHAMSTWERDASL